MSICVNSISTGSIRPNLHKNSQQPGPSFKGNLIWGVPGMSLNRQAVRKYFGNESAKTVLKALRNLSKKIKGEPGLNPIFDLAKNGVGEKRMLLVDPSTGVRTWKAPEKAAECVDEFLESVSQGGFFGTLKKALGSNYFEIPLKK